MAGHSYRRALEGYQLVIPPEAQENSNGSPR